jgi:hypothetical protein
VVRSSSFDEVVDESGEAWARGDVVCPAPHGVLGHGARPLDARGSCVEVA